MLYRHAAHYASRLVLSLFIVGSANLYAGFNPSSISTYAQEPSYNTGRVHIYGYLVETACRINMQSADQTISLGNVATADLKQIGSKARATPLMIELEDCVVTKTDMQNIKTGAVTWSNSQPGFKIRFLAPTVPTAPSLAQVSGKTGLGLEISNAQGVQIPMGEFSAPQLINYPQDHLLFQITPVRVGTLEPSAFNSLISFELDYD